MPVGSHILRDIGPDGPFGGGEPPDDFDVADPPRRPGHAVPRRAPVAADPATPPQYMVLPAISRLTGRTTRRFALIENESEFTDRAAEAQLGIVDSAGNPVDKKWMDEVTEDPAVGAAEIWEYYNTTADAHPMHVHEVDFQVVNRQHLVLDEDGEVLRPIQLAGHPTPPESWENGWKDTVVAYPGQVTRLRMKFGLPGQFVWHCHIVEHEDNEMMRPYRIGPTQPGQPDG